MAYALSILLALLALAAGWTECVTKSDKNILRRITTVGWTILVATLCIVSFDVFYTQQHQTQAARLEKLQDRLASDVREQIQGLATQNLEHVKLISWRDQMIAIVADHEQQVRDDFDYFYREVKQDILEHALHTPRSIRSLIDAMRKSDRTHKEMRSKLMPDVPLTEPCISIEAGNLLERLEKLTEGKHEISKTQAAQLETQFLWCLEQCDNKVSEAFGSLPAKDISKTFNDRLSSINKQVSTPSHNKTVSRSTHSSGN